MRQIIFQKAFDEAVEELGGYRHLDRAIDPVLDGLSRNPYVFHYIETEFTKFRYVITKPIEELPSYAIIFAITPDGDITLEDILENLNY